MKGSAFLAAVTLASIGNVAAWGNLGHEAVGYVAQQFLATKAAKFVKNHIPASDDHSLGPAATWADSVKYDAGYTWSAPLHFVDAEDDPLGDSCSVEETRDCGNGECILTAIANYTTRVADTSLSSDQRQEALMFLDHFLGDVGQPLHVENYEVGGNDIDAICGGDSTNLHAAWDTGMIETYLDANYNGSSETWANALVTEIKSGSFKSDTTDWLSCSDTTEPVNNKRSELSMALTGRSMKSEITELISARAKKNTTITPLECPLVWARESNAYDCTDVFDFKTGQDLCTGTYYNAAIPIINLQIAKQGYRLAAWLNVIFDGSTKLP